MKLVALHAEPAGNGLADMLRTMLARVEAGEVSSMAIAYVCRDGCSASLRSYAPNKASLVGAVAVMQHRLIEDGDDA